MSVRDRAFGATCAACRTGTVWATPDGDPIRLCGEHAELITAAPGWRRLHDDYAAHRCARCGHHSDWHRLDDALNVGPLDPPGARFRCLGGSDFGGCSQLCPDFVRPRRAAGAAVPPEQEAPGASA